MANKTIHELTPASTVDSSYEIAVYDIDGNGTKKATANQILKTSSLLYASDDDEPTGEVDFTSQDTTLTPSSSTSVDLLSGNDSWSQRFVKISQMFKNVRYLLSKLGTTDISSIGNGTVTGALSTLNGNLTIKNGTATAASGFTLSDTTVKQFGNVVFIRFFATKTTAIGSGSQLIATISGVPFPSNGIFRYICGSGAHAYDAYNGAYGTLEQDGKIYVNCSNTASLAVNIFFTYIIE